MQIEEIRQRLVKLFDRKLRYKGEMTLFIIEANHLGDLEIKFLSKQHKDYILSHLRERILAITSPYSVKFSHLNLKVVDIEMKDEKEHLHSLVNKRFEKKELIPKESSYKNKIIKEIEDFMYSECEKIFEKQKEIRENNEDYLDSLNYSSLFGEIHFIVKLHRYLQKIKEYGDD